MSKAFTSEETPDTAVVGRTARLAARGEERPITPEGYRALVEELRHLTDEVRPRVRADAVALSQVPRLAEIEHRIAFLQTTIASVRAVEASATIDRTVRFGTTVELERDGARRQVVRLVGPDEADAKAGRVSIESPLARSLLGRSVGDEVDIELPRGAETVRIIDVS